MRNNYVSGSAIPRVILKDFKNVPVPIIPKEEQTAIASILSSLDDKIDLLHRQNQTLEKMAETLFRQWFVEEAKEEWEVVKVGDFVATNSRTVTKEYPYSEIKYLDTSSLNEGLMSDFQILNLEEAPSRAKRLVRHNDVLISTVRPDQKHYGIVKEPAPDLVVSTGFCVISCKNFSPHFIYLLLTNNEMTDFLHSIAEGSTSTYPSLKPSDIEKIEFQLPPKEKIDDFEKTASVHWDKINSNQSQIRTLISMRDNLLPKLMSGEVRVDF
jgi:type I restriction enzyme S subunit